MLTTVLCVRCSQAENSIFTGIDDIKADNHGIFHRFGHLDSVQVLAKLSVDLLQDITVHSNLCTLDRVSQNKLGNDALFIQQRLDSLLVPWVKDDDHNKA